MPSSTEKQEVDVVIIGGGLVGLFTAHHLHKKGVRRIAVLEKGHAGGVASPRAGGLLRKHYNHPLLVEMAIHGDKQYAALQTASGYNIGYTQNGYLLVVSSEQTTLIERNIEMLRDLGVAISTLATVQLKREFPEFQNLGSDTIVAFERDSAFAHPPETVRALLAILQASDIKVHEGTPVTGIELKGGQVDTVITPRGAWKTQVVVNCAGAWGAHVGHMVGIELPIKIQRLLQIIELQHEPRQSTPLKTLSHEKADLYARPNGDSHVLVGGRIYFDKAVEPDEVNLLVDNMKAEQLRASYQEMSTLNLGRSTNGWVGIDGDTTDYQPILGPVGTVPGYYLATGFSAHGFKLAPIAGQLIAEHISSGKYTTLDATPLGLERFEKGELFPRGYKQMGA